MDQDEVEMEGMADPLLRSPAGDQCLYSLKELTYCIWPWEMLLGAFGVSCI